MALESSPSTPTQHTVASGAGSVAVGGDASGNVIITGENNTVILTVYVQHQPLESEPGDALHEAEGRSNPYRGLSTFQEADADLFFGRNSAIKILHSRFSEFLEPQNRKPRLLPILGPSGCGKSSLVRAGLLPALVRNPVLGARRLRVIVLTPGAAPVESLAGSVARILTNDPLPIAKSRELTDQFRVKDKGGYLGLRRVVELARGGDCDHVIVVVDQLEEIFTLCDDDEEREAFVGNLLQLAESAGASGSVIVTIPSDFHAETYRFPQLAEALSSLGYLVPPLGTEDLREIIEGPAARHGRKFSASFVDLLIEQTTGRSGALPLLETALTRIWEAGKGKEEDALRAVGGVGGALADAAERIYNALPTEAQKVTAKRAFLALVSVGEGARHTRRRATLGSVTAHGQNPRHTLEVLRLFASANARLLTLSAPLGRPELQKIQIDITHEVLIEKWDRLAAWVTERGDDLRLERRLADDAEEWLVAGRPEGMLWRPPELTALETLQRRRGADFSSVVREFSAASARAWTKQLALRRSLRLATVVAGLLILSFASWAMSAQTQARNRLNEQYVEQGRQELLAGRYDKAAVYLSAAYSGGSRTPALRYLLSKAMRVVEAQVHSADTIVASPSYPNVFGIVRDTLLAVWDPHSRKVTTYVSSWANCIIRAPDGAVVHVDTTDRVSIHTQGVQFPTTIKLESYECPLLSGDSSKWSLWFRSENDSLARWDVSGSDIRHQRTIKLRPSYSIAGVSSNGQFIAVETERREYDGNAINVDNYDLTILSANDGTQLHTVPHAQFAAFSPDSKEFLAFSGKGVDSQGTPNDDRGKWLRVQTGSWISQEHFHGDMISELKYACRAPLVVTEGTGRIVVWEAGKQVFTVSDALPRSADLSVDCKHIAVGDASGAVRIWGFRSHGLHTILRTSSSEPSPMFLPDGQTLAITLGTDDIAKVAFWRLDMLLPRDPWLERNDAVTSAFFAPDGKRLFVFERQRRPGTSPPLQFLEIWDMESRSRERVVGADANVYALGVSKSGKLAAGVDFHGRVSIWETHSGKLLRVARIAPGATISVLALPEDERVVLLSRTGVIHQVDLGTGTVTTHAHGSVSSPVCESFSADGKKLLYGDEHRAHFRVSIAPDFRRSYVLDLEPRTCGRFLDSEGQFMVLNMATSDQLWEVPSSGPPRRLPLNGTVLPVENAEQHVVVKRGDGAAIVRLRDGASVELEHPILGPGVFDGGQLMYTRGDDWQIEAWDLLSGRSLGYVPGGNGIGSLSISPDGTQLVATHGHGTLTWDVSSESRSPEKIARIVQCQVPFHIQAGRIASRRIDYQQCTR